MSLSTQILFVFPGQGAQYPGIGKDLYNAYPLVKQTYQEASEALDYDIAKLSFEDPNNQINLTRYTQPVLLTHHVACLRLLQSLLTQPLKANFSAGHSLGEYSALLSAGVIGFTQALSLVSKRGELMGQYGQGEMAALTLQISEAKKLADEFYCGVAALNLTEQTVVGGLTQDLEALCKAMAIRFPRKRSTPLKTEGAFHTYWMVEAAIEFRKVLDANTFKKPTMSVCSNFSGGFHDEIPSSIRSRLFMQLINPVLWVNNLQHVVEQGANLIIEFGGGIGKGETAADKRPNLEGIIKKTFRQHENPPQHLAVINQQSLTSTLETLQNII